MMRNYSKVAPDTAIVAPDASIVAPAKAGVQQLGGRENSRVPAFAWKTAP